MNVSRRLVSDSDRRVDDMASTTGKNSKGEMKTDRGAAGEKMDEQRAVPRVFERSLTVAVEIIGEDKITMMELLRGINEVGGLVMGCRFKTKNKYEITMSHAKGKERLMDGFKIKDSCVMAKDLSHDELVVSFLNLPTYISDEDIINKLTRWGVTAVSTIKRRMWPGTEIADGTRFCKVRFTNNVQSLPYSTKFETLEGAEYFRVIHDRQVKVCRLCIQPGHVVRDCPDFRCYKCMEQGHYARECPERRRRCEECESFNCICGERVGEELEIMNESGSVDEEECEEESELGEENDMEGISGIHEGVRNRSKSAEMGVTELGSSMDSAVEWLNSSEGVEGEDARCGRAQMDLRKAECGKDPCTEPIMEEVQPDGTIQNVKPIEDPRGEGGSSREVDTARDDSRKRKESEEELMEEERENIQSLRRDSKKNMIIKRKKKIKDQS